MRHAASKEVISVILEDVQLVSTRWRGTKRVSKGGAFWGKRMGSLADFVAKSLWDLGIRKVFGLPGGENVHLVKL